MEDNHCIHWNGRVEKTAVLLPGWPSPVGPGLLAQHFVSFQAWLVCLPECIPCPSNPDIFQKTEVADLVAHQGIIENVRSLFVIGLDASGKEMNSDTGPQPCKSTATVVNRRFQQTYPWVPKHHLTQPNSNSPTSLQGHLPNVVWIFCLEIFHQGSNWSLELWSCCWWSFEIDLGRVTFREQCFDKRVTGLPHSLGEVPVQKIIIFVNKSFHLVHNLNNRDKSNQNMVWTVGCRPFPNCTTTLIFLLSHYSVQLKDPSSN